MSNYKIDLSDGQIKSLTIAIQNQHPIRLRLTYKQIKGVKGVDLKLSKMHHKKIDKARKDKKGMVLNLSKAQIKKMQQGGILPVLAALAPVAIALLSGAAGAAGTYGANKLFGFIDKKIEEGKKKKGSALFPPGYTGQTGQAVVGYKPTGRGQQGGRRDAKKPAKPVTRHYVDWMTPTQIKEEREREKNMALANEEKKREIDEMIKNLEELPDDVDDYIYDYDYLYNEGNGLRPMGTGRMSRGNGLAPFGSGLFPQGVRPDRRR